MTIDKENKKKKKGIWARLLDWIARGTQQAPKKGQGVCRS
jgi:hypothetical protein